MMKHIFVMAVLCLFLFSALTAGTKDALEPPDAGRLIDMTGNITIEGSPNFVRLIKAIYRKVDRISDFQRKQGLRNTVSDYMRNNRLKRIIGYDREHFTQYYIATNADESYENILGFVWPSVYDDFTVFINEEGPRIEETLVHEIAHLLYQLIREIRKAGKYDKSEEIEVYEIQARYVKNLDYWYDRMMTEEPDSIKDILGTRRRKSLPKE